MKTSADRENQRSSARRPLRLKCQVVRETDFRLVATKTLDLSAVGMLVGGVGRNVRTGESVIVSFREPRSGRFFDAEATVARVVRGRRPGERGRHALGLRFVGMDAEVVDTLAQAIRGVPPVLPRRGHMQPRRQDVLRQRV